MVIEKKTEDGEEGVDGDERKGEDADDSQERGEFKFSIDEDDDSDEDGDSPSKKIKDEKVDDGVKEEFNDSD